MSRRTSVFVSYARDDASELVQRVRAYLDAGGADAFVDVIDIQGGDDWSQTIENKIRDSDAFVLIMTPDAIASAYVEKECGMAQDYQKRVIPLAMGDIKPPAWLREKQYISFKQFDDATALGKLTGAIKNVWEAVEQRIQYLRHNVISDELTPLLDHLDTFPKLPLKPVRPEVVLLCAEVAERLSNDSANTPIEDLIGEFEAGLYVTGKWQYHTVYEKHKVATKKILKEAFSHLNVRKVTIVPFVLVVMTAAEAAELESETVFSGSDQGLLAIYRHVLSTLQKGGLVNWTNRYHERPEEWQPFQGLAGDPSIAQLVSTELARPTGAGASDLRRAVFVDIRTLNSESDDLRELRETGCVVIIDTVSVCHPRLLSEYRRSMLDIFSTTFLLKIAPLDPVPVLGKDKEHVTTLSWVQRTDSYFYERRELVDPRCDVAGQDNDFKRFMREKVVQMFLKDYQGARRYAHRAP